MGGLTGMKVLYEALTGELGNRISRHAGDDHAAQARIGGDEGAGRVLGVRLRFYEMVCGCVDAFQVDALFKEETVN